MRPGFWPYLILRLRRVGKLFLPLLDNFCIIAPDRDIFFPADKVFAKAEKI